MIQTTEKQILCIALETIANAVEIACRKEQAVVEAMRTVRNLLSSIKHDDLHFDEKGLKSIETLRKVRYNRAAE